MAFLMVISIVVVLFVIIKVYCKLTTGWDNSFTCLVGKTVIVTGANRGIGFYTVLDFAKRGARIILACRDGEEAEKARKKIIELSGNSNIIVKLYDANCFASIRKFAKDFNDSEERLDILVNNAGAGGLGNTKSTDGLNRNMQINYYSSFLLTHLLIEKLKISAPSRIVNVSSIAHKIANIDPNNLDLYPPKNWYSEYVNYANSKLGNICFTLELARRLEGTGVSVNALHPGAILTDIFRRMKGWQKIIFMSLARTYFKTPLEGAQTTIYLSVSPELNGVSGKYFSDCKEKDISSSTFNNRDFLKRIWENTEKIVNVSEEEKILHFK